MNDMQKEFLKHGRDYGSATEFAILTRKGELMVCHSRRDAQEMAEQEYVDAPGQLVYPNAVVLQRDITPDR